MRYVRRTDEKIVMHTNRRTDEPCPGSEKFPLGHPLVGVEGDPELVLLRYQQAMLLVSHKKMRQRLNRALEELGNLQTSKGTVAVADLRILEDILKDAEEGEDLPDVSGP